MEIHVVIDDGDLSPGDYLTGTVYLHLTSYLPPPPPTIPTHLADDDDTEPSAHRTLLEAERHRLLHPSSPTPAVLERTELLDALQLQVMGKVLPDASKIPKAVISSFQPVAPDGHSLVVYSSPVVTLDHFDVPLAFDVLHQPYSYTFSALLPPSLPPSYRGASHRTVYYVSVLACKHEKGKTSPTVLADVKVPFKVRTSDLHYRAFAATSTAAPTPMDSFILLPAALRTRVHHRRVHPPVMKTGGREGEGGRAHRRNGKGVVGVDEAAEARVARLVERTQGNGARGGEKVGRSRDRDADATLPLPARQVLLFAPETMQRALEVGGGGVKGHRRALSLSPAASPAPSPYLGGAAPALADLLPPPPPPLPPPSDARAIHALLHRYRAVQLAGDPLASSPAPFPPYPSTLTTFLSAIRTPQSFNISEHNHAHVPSSSASSLPASLPVTCVTLERSAFRPGDTVRGHFDFSSAVLPTYRIVAHLMWVEDVRSLPQPQCRHISVVASDHWHCRQALRLPFALQLPADGTCNFASELVRGHWRLQFKFVVGTQRVRETRKGGGWFGGGGGRVEEEEAEEARRERERGGVGWLVYEKEGAVGSGAMISSLIAPDPSLSMSCLQWELPLDVVPVYDEAQMQPSIKSLLVDVETR